MPPNLIPLDITEIPDMDVLGAPTGIIKNLQEKIAGFYGAKASYLLVNGSSAGVIACICACCKPGDTLVVPRNAHVSVYNALVISGATPQYVMPGQSLDNIPQGATVLVVSPTYEGHILDIATIAKQVHAKQGRLIVDEAHGAHLPFIHKSSATTLGADMVVQSLHKTLPAFSQCAVVHCNNGGDNLQFWLNAIQTTSPSYMFMASCDYMLTKLWENPNCFANYLDRLQALRQGIPKENAPLALEDTHDPCKIWLKVSTHISGEAMAKIMAEKYKVQMEMATPTHVLAMTTVADTPLGFEMLKTAIDEINATFTYVKSTATGECFTLPKMAMTPREAIHALWEVIPWEAAPGRIAAQLVSKYPPGIALLAPGEVVPPGLEKVQNTLRVVRLEKTSF